MTARLYKPKRDDRVPVGQDVQREHAHKIAVEQLIPRIAVQNHIALDTVATLLYFYAKIPAGSGRRCSCFDIEASPNATCRCCYGTGTVGGYEKHGTHLEILDVTHPSIRAINCIPDYGRRSRPRQFILIPGAIQGHIISRMHIRTNIGEVDHVFALTDIPAGANVMAYIKSPVDTEWQEFTDAALAARLFNPWVDIKIQMTRPSIAAPTPRFGLLFVRYCRLVNRIIRANLPRTRKSNILQEFGVVDDWQEQHFWTDNTLRSITTEDWIAQINEGTRWKINGVNEFAPQDLLVSWDLDTRLIQHYEAMNFYPL